MKIKVESLEIHNMWLRDNSFKLTFDKRLTFLTGFNGSGKSTILEILYSSLQEGDVPALRATEWTTKATLSDGVIVYNSSFGHNLTSQEKKLESNIKKINRHLQRQQYSARQFKKEMFQDIQKNNIHNNQNNVTLSNEDKEDVNKRYLIRMLSADKNSPYAENNLNEIISPVLFKDEKFRIPNRPYANTDENSVSQGSLKGINKTLKELLIDFLGYESNSNKEKSIDSSAETEAILHNLKELASENKEIENSFEALKNAVKTAMANHNGFPKKKESKIKHFESLLNDFFSCTEKEVSRDERSFLAFKNKNDEIITWKDLSKGEKNLLGLFLLAFLSSDKNTLFILDEPDLSLHIEWQRKLIEILLQLAPESQFIIATHSPAMFLNDCEFDVINMKDITP